MVKKLLCALLALTLCLGLAVSVCAADEDLIIETSIYDAADLLSDSQEIAVDQKLTEYTYAYNTRLFILTVPSLDGVTVDDYPHYILDTWNLGLGETKECVLLLVCMDPREYRIVSNGFVGNVIDSYVIEDIGNAIVSDLSAGNYAAAFDEFAEQCAYYLNIEQNGAPFRAGKTLLIALIIGLVIALIVCLILKAQLKSVRRQDQANAYVKPGSMNITLSNDLFLYRNVTRTKKESSSSSSGSGPSRSSGGGSF